MNQTGNHEEHRQYRIPPTCTEILGDETLKKKILYLFE